MTPTHALPIDTISRRGSRAARLAAAVRDWFAIRATRDAVDHLDAHLLRDIGLDQPLADREIRRRLLVG